jgi:hypothetical protein
MQRRFELGSYTLTNRGPNIALQGSRNGGAALAVAAP